MLVKRKRGWEIPAARVTPQSIYLNRREVVRNLGLGAIGLAAGCYLSVDQRSATGDGGADAGPSNDSASSVDIALNDAGQPLYPAPRNALYQVAERPLTPENLGTRFNNYYEFTTSKDRVWQAVGQFKLRPWTIEVDGLVAKPQTIDFDDLLHWVPLEERIYRFRCVEAWAATIPWTGFPLAALIKRLNPLSSAKFIAMESVHRPAEMPGIAALPTYPWPYREALRLDEAMNELTLMVTGVYGKPAPTQNGAPLRLIVPWKYGFKSLKSIVRITFTETQPPTFWSTINSHEYGFFANVDPSVPHPRWSQETERMIDSGARLPTQLYNGYGDQVAKLYA